MPRARHPRPSRAPRKGQSPSRARRSPARPQPRRHVPRAWWASRRKSRTPATSSPSLVAVSERVERHTFRRRPAPVAAVVSLSLALALPARLAHAQGATDSATAESLFNEALALLANKKAVEACPKLEASQ